MEKKKSLKSLQNIWWCQKDWNSSKNIYTDITNEGVAKYENISFFNSVINYQINSYIETGRNDYTKFTCVAKLLRLIKVLDCEEQKKE